MSLLRARFVVLCLLSGAAWGALGWFFGGKAIGPPILGGVLAAPLIGVAVGFLFRNLSERSTLGKALLSLASLYFAATLFGLAVGVFDVLRGPERHSGEVVLQSVIGVWWGLTMTSFVLFFWPLTYLNHWLLDRAVEE